ncbi:MAG: hypothetical protein ACK4MV_01245 [Beijerinckiaceae bacterium]
MPISLSEARALYDGGAPVAHVAAALGLKADAFRRFRKKHGWPLRPSPVARRADAGPALAAAREPPHAPRATSAAAGDEGEPPATSDPPVDLPSVRRQVADAAQRELSKVQRTLSSGKTEDIERNARLLASLVKSLAELRRLESLDPLNAGAPSAVEGQDDQRPPRDLETLRDELARALERMSGEPGGPGAGG